MRERREAYIRDDFNCAQNQAIASVEQEIQVVVKLPKKLTQKELNENRAEKNMLKMALTLCSLSILSRLILIAFYVYAFFFYSFSGTLVVFIVNLSIFTLLPTGAIFVFYSFNKMFRDEFKKKFIIINLKKKLRIQYSHFENEVYLKTLKLKEV